MVTRRLRKSISEYFRTRIYSCINSLCWCKTNDVWIKNEIWAVREGCFASYIQCIGILCHFWEIYKVLCFIIVLIVNLKTHFFIKKYKISPSCPFDRYKNLALKFICNSVLMWYNETVWKTVDEWVVKAAWPDTAEI